MTSGHKHSSKSIASEDANQPSIEAFQAELAALRRELADLRAEKTQLELRLEQLAEHVAGLEAEIAGVRNARVREQEGQAHRVAGDSRDEEKATQDGPSSPLPGATASRPVLDPAALKNLREMIGDESEFMVEMIDTFLADAARLLTTIRQAAESENAASLQLAAHTLKSNSADFGATTLSTLCKTLEAKGRTENLEGVTALLVGAETEYEIVKTALMTLRQQELG